MPSNRADSLFYQLQGNTLITTNDMMDNRALAYGDGFFSTLGVYQGQPLWLTQHRQRLQLGMERFCLYADINAIIYQLQNLAQTLSHGMIKIIITRPPQSLRGYGFDSNQAQVFIKSVSMSVYQDRRFVGGFAIDDTKQTLCLSERLGTRPPRFAGLKLISSHEHVFAHQELLAQQKNNPQLGEGLLKNTQNLWISGTMSNVFYQLNHHWYTPPTQQSGVAGVLRSVLLFTTTAKERVLTDDDLPHLTGLFFCNAVRGILPIDVLWINERAHQLNAQAFLNLIGAQQ